MGTKQTENAAGSERRDSSPQRRGRQAARESVGRPEADGRRRHRTMAGRPRVAPDHQVPRRCTHRQPQQDDQRRTDSQRNRVTGSGFPCITIRSSRDGRMASQTTSIGQANRCPPPRGRGPRGAKVLHSGGLRRRMSNRLRSCWCFPLRESDRIDAGESVGRFLRLAAPLGLNEPMSGLTQLRTPIDRNACEDRPLGRLMPIAPAFWLRTTSRTLTGRLQPASPIP